MFDRDTVTMFGPKEIIHCLYSWVIFKKVCIQDDRPISTYFGRTIFQCRITGTTWSLSFHWFVLPAALN